MKNNYCNDIVCFYSNNNPYVKYEVEKDYAYIITENQLLILGGSYLSLESSYTEFNELLECI